MESAGYECPSGIIIAALILLSTSLLSSLSNQPNPDPNLSSISLLLFHLFPLIFFPSPSSVPFPMIVLRLTHSLILPYPLLTLPPTLSSHYPLGTSR